jgi:hypothetical protein
VLADVTAARHARRDREHRSARMPDVFVQRIVSTEAALNRGELRVRVAR